MTHAMKSSNDMGHKLSGVDKVVGFCKVANSFLCKICASAICHGTPYIIVERFHSNVCIHSVSAHCCPTWWFNCYILVFTERVLDVYVLVRKVDAVVVVVVVVVVNFFVVFFAVISLEIAVSKVELVVVVLTLVFAGFAVTETNHQLCYLTQKAVRRAKPINCC